MAYFYYTHNFGTREHFGFDVISLKVSQTELQSSRKSDTVLTQYPDREIPPICSFSTASILFYSFIFKFKTDRDTGILLVLK